MPDAYPDHPSPRQVRAEFDRYAELLQGSALVVANGQPPGPPLLGG